MGTIIKAGSGMIAVLLSSTAFADDGRRAPAITELIERVHIGGGEISPHLAVSPDGDAVVVATIAASVETNDRRIDWHIVDGLDSERPVSRRLHDGGEAILNIRQRMVANGSFVATEPKWSPDGQWIAYAAQQNGEIQLWRMSRDGRVNEQLTHNAADIFGSNASEALFEWSADGRTVFYEVARPRALMAQAMQEEGRRGFLYDDRFDASASYQPFWMRCGVARVVNTAPVASQACEPVLWVHEIATKTDRLASEAERSEYERLRRGADGAVAVRNVDSSRYRGFQPPLQIELTASDGTRQSCPVQACISPLIENAWLLGDDVVIQRRENAAGEDAIGREAFYQWSPASNTVERLFSAIAHFSECSPAGVRLICFRETAVQPRQLVSLDPFSGTHAVLMDPNPDLSPARFTMVEHIERRDAQMNSMTAELVYPAGYQPGIRYPLIIVQGAVRGFLDGGTGMEYPVHPLAQQGFFVLNTTPYENFDLRASLPLNELSQAEFRTFDRRRRALDAFRDVVEDVVSRGLVDRDRIAITGLSSGSANARYALIHSDLFALASLSTGYSGPQQYWFAPLHVREWMRSNAVLGDGLAFEPPFEQWLAGENLGFHAREAIFPPVLWQVSDDELSHALFDYALLEDEGHPVEMYVFPDEHHIRHQPVHRNATQRRNLQWFQFWLQGVVAPDPVDPAQYDRWRELCRSYLVRLRNSTDPAQRARISSQRCARQLH